MANQFSGLRGPVSNKGPISLVNPNKLTTPKGSIAAGVVSGLGDIANAFISTKRTKNIYKFNAEMAQLQGNFNAQMAKLQGRMIRLSANVEIENIRNRAESLYSAQRAGFAKAGVSLEGSPAAVLLETLEDSEYEAIFVDISAKYNVGLTETQASIYKLEAKTKGNLYDMYSQSSGFDAIQTGLKSIINIGTKQLTRG